MTIRDKSPRARVADSQTRNEQLLRAGLRAQAEFILRSEQGSPFALLLDEAAHATGSEVGFLAEIDDGGLLELASIGCPRVGWATESILGEQGQSAVAGLEEIIIDDFDRSTPDGLLIRSIASLPLLQDRNAVGVLVLANWEIDSGLSLSSDLGVLREVAATLIIGGRDARAARFASEELRSCEARRVALATSAVDGVVTVDVHGTVMMFNSSAEKIFGYKAEEVVGNNLSMLMPNPYRDLHDEFIRRYLETGERKILEVGREVEGLRKDGSSVPLHLLVNETRVGDVHQFTGVIRDLTRIRATEQELRAAREMVHVADGAKHQFLGTLSHEVRTPLNVILGAVDLLQDSALDDQQVEHIDTISTSADNLLYLINDFIDLTRIESGLMVIENMVFDLETMIEEVLVAFRRQTDLKGLALEVSFSGDYMTRLIGDRQRIGQILSNLLGNAVKFTPEGSINLEVEVQPSKEGPESRIVVFRVTDSGIGIRQEFQQHLFERFFKGDASSTRRFDGTGLGLNICATLADLMGGRIWLEESKPGHGSTFVFKIPMPVGDAVPERMQAGDRRDRRVESGSHPLPSDAPGRPARILLAEDNAANRTVVSRLLEQAGHTVDEAENGEEAVLRASQFDYDLIFLDLSMPVLDGFDAARKIRQGESSRTPIVALTAHVGESFRQRCIEAGMDGFLAKPVNKAGLLVTVARWCDPEYSVVVFAVDKEASHQYVTILEGSQFRAIQASTMAETEQLAKAHEANTVILDVASDLISGLSTVEALRQNDSRLSIVFMSDDSRPDVARSALAAGCTVVLAKPVLRRDLLTAVRSKSSEAAAYKSESKKGKILESEEIEVTVDPDIEDLVANYLAMLRRQVHELRDLAESGEMGKIRTLGHNLKGSAGAYGFHALGEIGAELEDAAKAAESVTIDRLRTKLASYLSRVVISGR